MTRIIPLTALDVEGAEPDARSFLPPPMRQPGLADCVATTLLSPLSGLGQSVVADGSIVASANLVVLLTRQADARQNGPWVCASGSWTRLVSGPADPIGAMTPASICSKYTMLVARGPSKGYWWCTSQDPVMPGRTEQTWERLGNTLYDWHAQQAETTIWADLNKRHQPIRPETLYGADTLTRALAHRVAFLLANTSMVEAQDQAASRRKYHEGRYQAELEQAVLRTASGARIRGGEGRKVLRG